MGTKPACDGAVTAITSETHMPIILFEYKPVVDLRLEAIDLRSLMETLIQGYYCIYQHKVCSIIHCLTDLFQWYYESKAFEVQSSLVTQYI